MRWLFINPIKANGWGGMENWMLRLSLSMMKKGDACAIVARPDSRWPIVCGAYAVKFFPFTFGADLMPTAILKLSHILKEVRPDAVCVKGFRQVRFARLADHSPAVIVKLPMPYDLTDSLIDRWTYNHCIDRVIVDSHAARRAFERHPWALGDKICVVHNGLNAEGQFRDPAQRSALRKLLQLPEDTFLIGASGRFTTIKRYENALDAFASCAARHKTYLVMMGDGPEKTKLEARANGLNLSGRIRFLGWRDDAESLVQGLDIFLHPSSSEGLPNAVLEAMSAGVVPIASRAGGTAEMIRHAEEGFLTEIGETGTMAKYIDRLFLDRGGLLTMANRAYRRARTEFTEEAMSDGVHRVLAEAAGLRQSYRAEVSKGADGWRWVGRNIQNPHFNLLELPWDSTASLVKNNRDAKIVRAEFEGRQFYARVFTPAKFADRLQTFLGVPPSLGVYKKACRLGLMGISTVPHITAGWKPRNLSVEECVLITERPRPSATLPEMILEQKHNRAWRRRLARQLGRWVAAIHSKKVMRCDLRASNILCLKQNGDETIRLTLIDVGSCCLRTEPTTDLTARNLFQLQRSLDTLATLNEKLRFAAAYKRARRLSRADLRVIRASVRQARETTTGARRAAKESKLGKV